MAQVLVARLQLCFRCWGVLRGGLRTRVWPVGKAKNVAFIIVLNDFLGQHGLGKGGEGKEHGLHHVGV